MYEAATKHIPAALALCLGITLSGCGDKSKSTTADQAEASQHFERSQSYLQQGQYRAAFLEAQNAAKLAPNDMRNSVLMAHTLNEIGQTKPAAALLEPLAQKGDANLVQTLVESYVALRKYQTALDCLAAQRTRLHISDNPEWDLLTAQALAGTGRFDEANKLLQTLAKQPKFATRAELELARNTAAQGDRGNALARAQEILKRDPKDVPTLLLAARLSDQAGNLQQAEDLLGHALVALPQTDVLSPTKVAVLETLTLVLTKLGRSSEALVYTKALSDADPERVRLQEKFKQAMELFQSGKLAEAEPLLTEIYQQSKNDTAGILLGMIKYSKNDMAGAAQYLSAHVDPEVAPDEALLALAATDLRSAQPGKLLETFGPEQRARLKNPQLKALIGIALLETGKTEEGQRLITQAQTEQPNNTAIAATLARHYLSKQQPQQALDVLQKALPAHPQDAGLNQLLISTYLGIKDNAKALDAARKLAAQQPEKAENLAVLGHTALLTQQLDVAATALRKAVALDPKLTSAQFDLGQLYLLQKNGSAAEAQFKASLQADGDNPTLLKSLITAHEISSGREASLNSIEQWLPGLKTSANVRAVAAEYYIRNGRIADAERLLQSNPETTEQNYTSYVRQLLAVARSDQAAGKQNFSEARNELVKALRINPNSVALLGQLARLELRANAPQEAAKVAAQIEQLQPKTPALEELKADIASAQQHWPDAITRYRALWQLRPTDAVAMKLHRALQASDAAAAGQFLAEWQTKSPNSPAPALLRGMAAEQKGDAANAIHAYEEVLTRDANNTAALNNLALLYLAKGDSRARDMGAKAYQLQPQNPAVIDTYGWVLSKTGDKQKGLELLKKAQSMAPNIPEIAAHVTQAEAMH